MNNRDRDGGYGGRADRGGGGGGGGRGGGGGFRGGGRGGGGGGAPGRKEPAPLNIASNHVGLEGDVSGTYDLWSVMAKGPRDEIPANPLSVNFEPGRDKVGTRVLKKEITNFLCGQFGEGNFTYDGAAVIIASKKAKTPTVFTHQYDIGRETPDTYIVYLDRAKTKSIDTLEQLDLMFNQIFGSCIKQSIEAEDGDVQRKGSSTVYYPSLKSDFGRLLDHDIDRQDRKNQRDIDSLLPFTVRRGFECQAHFYADMNVSPPPNPSKDFMSEVKRGAYKSTLTVLIKTGCHYGKGEPLLTFLNYRLNDRGHSLACPGSATLDARLKNKMIQKLLIGQFVTKNAKVYSAEAQPMLAKKKDDWLIIDSFSSKTAKTHTFEKDGKKVSIAEYMKSTYNMTLKYPDLPVVVVRSGGRKEEIPAELLFLIPQFFSTFTNHLQNYFTNVSRISTERQKSSILKVTKFLISNKITSAVLGGWGIRVTNDLKRYNAYLCTDPSVQYKEGRKNVANGRWNMAGSVVASHIQLNAQKILFIDLGSMITSAKKKTTQHNPFRDLASRMMAEIGTLYAQQVPMSKAVPIPFSEFEHLLTPQRCEALVSGDAGAMAKYHGDFCACLKDLLAKRSGGKEDDAAVRTTFAMAFVLLPPENICGSEFVNQMYTLLKIFFNEGYSIPTQMFKPEKTPMIKPGQMDEDHKIRQHFAALIAGINIKSGYHNFSIDSALLQKIGKPSTVMMGIDLQHGNAAPHGKVSTCGVTMSIDERFNRYVSAVSIQPYRDDIIGNMRDLMSKLIARRIERQMKVSNKEVPIENIILYRDGVDFGSYSDVLKREVLIIEAVCTEKYGKKPNVTVIVCMKRHATRMLPENMIYDRNGNPSNVPPGTVCGLAPDRKPLAPVGPSPVCPTFYLMGHEAIPGSTALPLRLTILQNRTDMNAWDLATLTFAVHHADQVVTKSVSLPAPVLYAHKLCDHAKAVSDYKNRITRQCDTITTMSDQADSYVKAMTNLGFL
eukprot:GHVH01011441.1.p1 GENE.GHVH01011441.1~~GHVH01011441.1.p1  ORF type:complete len:1001 (+),score=144.65 GHVH01011441.1:61-3063(+)